MTVSQPSQTKRYGIEVQPLTGRVTAYRGDQVVASSTRARVMYETRLPPTVYFPTEDILATLSDPTDLQTFCPFKGTASYRNVGIGGDDLPNGIWSYDDPLPESRGIHGYSGISPAAIDRMDLGDNTLRQGDDGNISGPLVDWLMRGAGSQNSPEAFTAALAEKMLESGIAISRFAVMIWSLHPLIVGKNYIWSKDTGKVTTFAPSYELHDHPSFVNSPLRHVSNGLGGVRQKLGANADADRFPIMADLREKGATDYVAMPLPFSDGRTNVLTLTCDHPDGFTTANLGLIFECSAVISRFYEVFMQKENARSLLDTYVGKRTGARVLGGEIRRGDGDEIDAAIMFCDLRGSTRLEEELGRGDYIRMLNQFFETTSTIIEDHNGEVLKFIGDAVLAVFPAQPDAAQARKQALQSANQIVMHLAALRRDGDEDGNPVNCDCSIGIAYGGVTYGNVGSRERLDFTVIGRAANVAARLGDHGKSLGHRIVVSDDFTETDTPMQDLGQVVLHNVSQPVSCRAMNTVPT